MVASRSLVTIVKTAEIGIMLLGAGGLMVARAGYPHVGIGLMLGAVLFLGVHSTFFGPIKFGPTGQVVSLDPPVFQVQKGKQVVILPAGIKQGDLQLGVK